jgi:hypothetical protein
MKMMKAAAIAAFAGASALASNVTVYSNNNGGDAFTNAGTSVAGQAIGSSGWHYNNVRNNGVAGISTQFARNGNGSLAFNLTQGPGGNSSKADVEFFNTAAANGNGNFAPTSSLGTLGSLSSLSYDWYRSSGGAANQWLHAVVRLQVFDANTGANGYLVFEREVNRNDFGGAFAAAPVDTWVSEDIMSGDYRLWATGGSLPNNLNGTNGVAQYYDARRLSEWMSQFSDYLVVGLSLGVGSGWGSYTGAIDNVTFGFSGNNTTYNFEVEGQVIPTPLAGVMGGAGLMLVGARRRR